MHNIEPPNILIFKEDGERKISKVNYYSLINDDSFELISDSHKRIDKQISKAESNQRSLVDALPDKRRELAFKKLSWIKPILTWENAKSGDMYAAIAFSENYKKYLKDGETVQSINKKTLIERISENKDCGKSTRQLERYLADYLKSESQRENHGIEGLVSKAHMNTHVRIDDLPLELCHPKKKELVLDTIYVRLGEEYIPILKVAIENYYLGKRRKNVAKLHVNIEIMCINAKIESLDYDTVYKIVNRINPYVLEKLAHGDGNTDPKIVNSNANQSFAKAPLQVIEIDHVKLPITVIDENTGYDVGEPWLTLAVDVYTRKIWGMDLSLHDPSGHKVMNCIFNGICMKRTKEKYGTINDWDFHGIPTVFLMDNGSDFTSNYVKSMIEDVLHSEVRYRPIATPRYGGIIERYFRTINQEFLEDLLGFRYKRNDDNNDRKAAAEDAILTLNNLRELLVHYITDIYHHDVHKGLPLECNTPCARYYQAIEIMGYPPFIKEEDEPYYKIQLLPSTMKSYRNDGIREENVKYASPETARFISNKRKNNCKIKFDIEDISRIYLLDPESKSYIEVPSIYPPADEISGMSRKLFQIIRKLLIEKGEITKQQIPGSANIVKGKELLAAKYEAMVKTNMPIRRLALNAGLNLTVNLPSSRIDTPELPLSRRQQLLANLNNEKKKNG
ncbi:Mu transposase C-terminal domain-containing protein [Paenibacillus pectinilyticus]|uniref:Mu transposase C-terminal domain-containing protein n=1 Tax=Paenibacillus pectinilyticus TaxID=512399 RepID=UPI001428B92F|nr:Mu transposase C-terminal domain-containing protein [Paenibacillus pectinilyticus]